MSDDRQFLRIQKLTGKGKLLIAAKHNLRELQAELGAESHIDATRTGSNVVMAGATHAGGVADAADSQMLAADVGKLRKDAVRGLELVISLPPASRADQPAFFADALAWARSFYGLPVLSAVIHNDEAVPHCHIILLPLIDGRMKGSDLVGNRKRLQAMQTSFYEKVGEPHGLMRPKAAQRLSAATRAKSASMILSAIQSDADLLDRPDIEAALLTAIGRDPVALLDALSMRVPHPPKSKKTFFEIMTKPCPPEKPIGFAGRSKPIGFDVHGEKKGQTLSCVGFAPESPPIPAPKPLQAAFADDSTESADDYTRTRDDDPAAQWDERRGEFVRTSPSNKPSVRLDAQAEINRALRQRFH